MASMIPKTIITIWLGSDMPEHVEKCVRTHDIPGYEHLLITNKNVMREYEQLP